MAREKIYTESLLADLDNLGTRMSEGKRPHVGDYKIIRAASAAIRNACTCPVCNEVDMDGLEACASCYGYHWMKSTGSNT